MREQTDEALRPPALVLARTELPVAPGELRFTVRVNAVWQLR